MTLICHIIVMTYHDISYWHDISLSAPADRDASQLYYSCLIISVGGKGGGGHLGDAWRGGWPY